MSGERTSTVCEFKEFSQTVVWSAYSTWTFQQIPFNGQWIEQEFHNRNFVESSQPDTESKIPKSLVFEACLSVAESVYSKMLVDQIPLKDHLIKST